MIRQALRRATALLASGRFATLLLVFLGAWSVLASLVPQAAVSVAAVAAWAAANPILEPVVRFFGLHEAFGAPVFLLAVLVLAVSTALCAWQRTKAAAARGRALRAASALDAAALAAEHDLEIPCDPALCSDEVLAVASGTLAGLGIRTKAGAGTIASVSQPWSAWGSPVFHWALLALIVTIPLGTMFRSSGQMGLAVGQAKADEPASYGVLSAGPLSGLFKFPRTIRVDAFDVNYAFGGVVRGPTPTVSILDAQGAVVATQRVYPNNTLSVGTLTIYPADYGFAAGVVLIDANGVESGRSLQLVDFSTTATGGTAPVGYLTIGDASGRPTLKVRVSVPLDRVAGGYAGRLPTDIRALVVVSDVAGTVLLEQPLRPGELLKLPAGGTLKLDSLGYYARLQLVDDPSIPILYVGMLVAMAGLGVATLSRQHIVAATVLQRAEGLTLAVKMRLWRNTTTTRSQIGSELARALGGPDREEPS